MSVECKPKSDIKHLINSTTETLTLVLLWFHILHTLFILQVTKAAFQVL